MHCRVKVVCDVQDLCACRGTGTMKASSSDAWEDHAGVRWTSHLNTIYFSYLEVRKSAPNSFSISLITLPLFWFYFWHLEVNVRSNTTGQKLTYSLCGWLAFISKVCRGFCRIAIFTSKKLKHMQKHWFSDLMLLNVCILVSPVDLCISGIVGAPSLIDTSDWSAESHNTEVYLY